MNPYILSLSDPQADLATAGGTGASLANLIQAGLPVPGGFHITTAAYREFIADNGLQPHILAALSQVDPQQPATLETASDAIYQLFAAAEIPAPLASTIQQAYAALPGKDPAVAVRSSATAEDLPEASFAGQQEGCSGPCSTGVFNHPLSSRELAAVWRGWHTIGTQLSSTCPAISCTSSCAERSRARRRT